LQKEYARKLLTHYNPYTKSEYRNEPAIAIIEIVNENSLVGAWAKGRLRGLKTEGPPAEWQDITPYYERELTALYDGWLKQRGAAPVPRLEPSGFASASSARFQTELAFYMETERDFFRGMRSFLKDTLGTKSLLVGTSDFSYGFSSLPMLTSNSELDIIDTHGPWELRPMVNEPLNSIPVRVSRSAMSGKPLTVSEHNHRFPNDYISEGIPLLAAYGSFQDWDGIFLYTFELKPPGFVAYIPSRADLSHDPVKLANLAAGALLFLRADVHPARETVERTYTPEQVKESLRVPASAGVYFTPGFTPGVALRHGSRIRSLSGAVTQQLSYPEANPIVSDTGELSWYVSGKSMVSVDTPRTQALIGFVPANRKLLTNFSADIRNSFASLVLTSLNADPIARSARLLLCVTAREANTNNGPPTVIEPVAGKIFLRNLQPAASVEISPLDGAGKPSGNPTPLTNVNSQWQCDLRAGTTWYLISVRR